METKKCGACGVVKPITEFHKNKSRKDGLQHYCKICHRKNGLEYHYRNRERRLKYKKNYDIKNRESKLQYQRDYWATPRGKIIKKGIAARRRARKMGNTPTNLLLTTKQLEKLHETTTHCPYCNVDLSTVKIELDHVIPLSRGGQHSIDNVVLCCEHCNKSKGAKEPIQWMLDNGIEFGFMTNAGYISAYEQE